jgi:hypothetical protein
MASVATRAPRPAVAGRDGRALLLILVAILLLGLALPRDRARAGDARAGELVAAATAAYGPVGTLAVVVARQQVPVPGLSPRAADARTTRLASGGADNGLADRPFPTASLVKLFVAEDILHRARAGEVALTPGDFGLLRTMIQRSDDAAASTLWVRFGGGQMVTDVARRYELTGTVPPSDPGQWGQTTTTGRDLARFLSLLPVVAHRYDAGALMVWMRTATPLAADGFDQRFGIFGTTPGLPAVKQGWMCCLAGKRHLHSVGVIDDRVVVLLSEVPRSVSYDEGRAALTAAAAAIPRPSGL